MNIVLRSNWFVSAGRYLFLNYFLLTEKVSKILIKTVLMKNSLNLFNSFAMVLSPFTSYFNVFYLVFTDWSIMKTIETESPFTGLSPHPNTESFSLLKQVNSYLQHLVFPILTERTLFPMYSHVSNSSRKRSWFLNGRPYQDHSDEKTSQIHL